MVLYDAPTGLRSLGLTHTFGLGPVLRTPEHTAFPVFLPLTPSQIVRELDDPGAVLKILIADDHEMIRKGVCALLAEKNEVAEATNGAEAVEKALELKPDLIILDVAMPVLSGLSAARKIRAALPHVPILILSMHDGDHILREVQATGAQGFVAKSEAGLILLKAVEALLKGQTFFRQLPT
jgi:CheY-like chemotaxis protein